jgi:C-terminal processing protease CtpA/Prc
MKYILKNVANEISKNFYDPKLKGLDWKAAVDEAKQKIDAAKSINEMEVAIFQFVEKLDDSHTTFIPPDSATVVKYGFDAKPYGKEIRIFEVDRGGAAETAGLKVGDRLMEINGFLAERASFEKLMIYTRKLYQISPMNLNVDRPGVGALTVSIVPKINKRAIVMNREANFNAIWALALDDFTEWHKKYGTYRYSSENGIGYLQLREFPDDGQDFLKGLAEKSKGADAVIIDLRDCPGGALKTLLSFAGLFQTTEGILATEVDRAKSEPMKIKPQRPFLGGSIFILVDSTTASAAELLARHLQKTRNAVVIGDDTAAAVTVGKVLNASVGGSLVTEYGIGIGIGRVVFPDGEELEKKGITPDMKCLPTQRDMFEGKDPCLAQAYKLAAEARNAAQSKSAAGKN